MPLPTSKLPKFNRVIFVDRSLASKRLLAGLMRFGFEVEPHNDHFVHDADDEDWIPVVSSRNWIILTADRRISKLKRQIAAVRKSKAQIVFVTDSNSLPECHLASFYMGHVKLAELLAKNPGPCFLSIGGQSKEHVKLVKEHLFHGTAAKSDEPQAADVRGSGDRPAEGSENPDDGRAPGEAVTKEADDKENGQEIGVTSKSLAAPTAVNTSTQAITTDSASK